METSTSVGLSADATSAPTASASASRTRLLAIGLGVAAVAAVPLQLLWPVPSDGMHFSHADVAPDREQVWLVLSAVAAVMVIAQTLQALATMRLVTGRGSTWATVGGVLLFLGCAVQAVGIGGWASAYFVATDPELGETTGASLVESFNGDEVRLYGFTATAAVLVTLGVVAQCVGLLRAKVVPTWIPVALLFMLVTFVVPSTGPAGLITTIPMTLGALGLAAHVLRRA